MPNLREFFIFQRIMAEEVERESKRIHSEETSGSEKGGNETPECTHRPGDPFKTLVDIRVAGRPPKTVVLTVDPGSAVSFLPRRVYEADFKDVPLHRSAALLVTTSQSATEVLGCMQATVHKVGVRVPANFYVVDEDTIARMGRDLISALHLRINA